MEEEMFKPGDLVRVLSFRELGKLKGAKSAIIEKETDYLFEEPYVYGIAKSVIDRIAEDRPYYTVSAVTNGNICGLAKTGFHFLASMLAPYEDPEDTLPDEPPDRIFTDLFGIETEVIR